MSETLVINEQDLIMHLKNQEIILTLKNGLIQKILFQPISAFHLIVIS